MNFDVHVHLDIGTDVSSVVAQARQIPCRLGVSSCGPVFHQPGNEAVAEAFHRYADTVFGFGYVALGRGDGPETIEDLYRQGFRALKAIVPKKDYDDESFFPIYAKAEELGLPILFHTGVVARVDLWPAQYGWEDTKDLDFRQQDISSKRMRPICLDAIARAFPRLNLIMAHFCSLGRRDEAAAVLHHNPNVYADLTNLSNATTEAQIKANAQLLESLIISPQTYERLLFGTDFTTSGGTERLERGIKVINGLIDELDLSEELRRKIMGETAECLIRLG